MYTFESRQDAQWRLIRFRLGKIEFHHLIPRHLARVLHVTLECDWITSFNARRNFQTTVRETGVAKSIAKSIERLVCEISVSPAAHGVLLKWWDLLQRRVKR